MLRMRLPYRYSGLNCYFTSAAASTLPMYFLKNYWRGREVLLFRKLGIRVEPASLSMNFCASSIGI